MEEVFGNNLPPTAAENLIGAKPSRKKTCQFFITRGANEGSTCPRSASRASGRTFCTRHDRLFSGEPSSSRSTEPPLAPEEEEVPVVAPPKKRQRKNPVSRAKPSELDKPIENPEGLVTVPGQEQVRQRKRPRPLDFSDTGTGAGNSQTTPARKPDPGHGEDGEDGEITEGEDGVGEGDESDASSDAEGGRCGTYLRGAYAGKEEGTPFCEDPQVVQYAVLGYSAALQALLSACGKDVAAAETLSESPIVQRALSCILKKHGNQLPSIEERPELYLLGFTASVVWFAPEAPSKVLEMDGFSEDEEEDDAEVI